MTWTTIPFHVGAKDHSTRTSVSLGQRHMYFSAQPLTCCSEFSCLSKPTEISVLCNFLISSKPTDDNLLPLLGTRWRSLKRAFQSRSNPDDCWWHDVSLCLLVPFLCSCWFVYIVHIDVLPVDGIADIPLHQPTWCFLINRTLAVGTLILFTRAVLGFGLAHTAPPNNKKSVYVVYIHPLKANMRGWWG